MRSLLFFLLIPALLPAQSDFLKNPDIVWAAEIEQDWVMDIPSLETEWEEGITTLKLLRTENNAGYWSSPYLAELVFEAMTSGKLPVFKDPACSIPVDFLEMISAFKDTVSTFDPETYEEKTQVYYYEPNPLYDFKAWRLRQILAYHKDATWSTTVEAIAPLFLIKNKEGDSLGVRPLCWFRPDNKRQKLTSNNIVWAKQTINKQEKTRISIVREHTLKVSDQCLDLRSCLINILENRMQIPLFNSDNGAVLTPEARLSMIVRTDTVIRCFSEGPESTYIISSDVTDQINDLRLLQTWYWDSRQSCLSICLDAVAPLIDVLSNEGDFRFRKPLFYMRVSR